MMSWQGNVELFGGTLAIAVFGSIGTAAYRNRVAETVPDGVPPDAAEAARDTLGAAVAVAAHLPDPLSAGCSTQPARPSPRRCN
jgi:DHA2 family multidrug resistance protein-like MFS transporter